MYSYHFYSKFLAKEQIKEWKLSDEAASVHEDLYKPSDQDDEHSETYLHLIIKNAFSEDEVTPANIVWAQSVLEAIFDVDHLSTKIDNDIIEMWTKIINKTIKKRQVISVENRVANRVAFPFLLLNILLLLRLKMMKRTKRR